MDKLVKVVIVLLLGMSSHAQELFVFTEPASTMAGNSLGFRMMESVMDDLQDSRPNIHMMPEVMYGFSDKLMVHAQGFISNRTGVYKGEGAALYAQYKFLNNDEVQRHFRMAAYGRAAINKSDIHQDEIELVGHNTGFEAGMIATQLLHKVALSSSVSFEQAYDNVKYDFPSRQADNAINYTLSAGKLMLPKKYTSFKQTNFNLMVEFLGQRLNANGKSYLDIAPSVQFIFLSRARLEIGYRHELYSTMERTAPNGFVFRLDYSFYNVF
jgi:hypothetical protein